jgi:hypothetical protein
MSREIDLEEKYKLLQEQYNVLESIHNLNVKQYEHLQERCDDILILAKRYAENAEYRIKKLEEENKRLKEQSDCYGID